jgi:tetratricopeptide (TPR) repeat protein
MSPILRCARSALASFFLYAAVSAGVAPSAVSAQIPDKFTNLKVLPTDISRAELTATMRSFTEALGVRCSACHVGEEGQPLSQYDFASDDKQMKLKARVMLRMVKAINGEFLANLPDRHEPNVSVSCITCHGGARRPEPIDDIVEQAIASDGLDSAVARYKELRARYYGSRAYDFTDQPLVAVARKLSQDDQVDDAMRVLELNLEFLPESAMTYVAMGQLHERAGEKDKAIEAYTKALEIQPNNRMAQQRLKELKGGGGQ